MSAALVVGVLILLVLGAAVLLGVCLLVPAVARSVERVRVEREAAEASWRIHQQATEAFSQMLEAARESGPSVEEQS